MVTRGTPAAGRHRAPTRSGRRPLFLLTGLTAGVAAAMLLGAPVLGEPGDPGSRQDLDVASGGRAPQQGTGPGAGGAVETPAMTVLPGRTLEREPAPEVAVPESASGTFAVAGVRGPTTSRPAAEGARLTTYRVEVEGGLPFDADEVAAEVERILSDERGWITRGHLLVREDGPADLRILLAAPTTVDRLCAPLLTRGRLSCRNGANVVLNAWRWHHGAETYGDDLTGYREYLVNHETGHALGYGHLGCPEPGAPAPVMVQQTKTLFGCAPNPWPADER